MKLLNVSMISALGLGFGLTPTLAQTVQPPHYVAMGSSFAAGPGILPGASDPGSVPCGRSNANYAHVLASRNKLALTDVSCGGATTANILERGQFGAAAQLDAVTADTQLVTVTIGGNDVFYTASMGGLACQNRGKPAEKLQPYCIPPSDEKIEAGFAGLDQHLREIAAEVRKRAPAARVIFVDYLSILPPEGTCTRLALTAAETGRLRAMATRLDKTIAGAAKAERADYLAVSTLSRGHDACSEDPWTNGFSIPTADGKFEAIPFHPNARGMDAIATSLGRLLSHKRP